MPNNAIGLKKLTRDDTVHDEVYYLASDVDALIADMESRLEDELRAMAPKNT